MSEPRTLENQFLSALPKSERDHLLSHSETVSLPISTTLWEPGYISNVVYFITVFSTQIAQSVVCNRFHHVDERLARWS